MNTTQKEESARKRLEALFERNEKRMVNPIVGLLWLVMIFVMIAAAWVAAANKYHAPLVLDTYASCMIIIFAAASCMVIVGKYDKYVNAVRADMEQAKTLLTTALADTAQLTVDLCDEVEGQLFSALVGSAVPEVVVALSCAPNDTGIDWRDRGYHCQGSVPVVAVAEARRALVNTFVFVYIDLLCAIERHKRQTKANDEVPLLAHDDHPLTTLRTALQGTINEMFRGMRDEHVLELGEVLISCGYLDAFRRDFAAFQDAYDRSAMKRARGERRADELKRIRDTVAAYTLGYSRDGTNQVLQLDPGHKISLTR